MQVCLQGNCSISIVGLTFPCTSSVWRLVGKLRISSPYFHLTLRMFLICVVTFLHSFKYKCLPSCLCLMLHRRVGEREHLEHFHTSISHSWVKVRQHTLKKVAFVSFHYKHVHLVRELLTNLNFFTSLQSIDKTPSYACEFDRVEHVMWQTWNWIILLPTKNNYLLALIWKFPLRS